MLNRLARLGMSTSVLKALSGKLAIKRHSPSILYVLSLKITYEKCNICVYEWERKRTTVHKGSLRCSSMVFLNMIYWPTVHLYSKLNHSEPHASSEKNYKNAKLSCATPVKQNASLRV